MSLLVYDLRDRAQLFRCRCPKTEELQVRGSLLEQHIGADLDRTTHSFAARRNGVISCFITTSPTNAAGAIRLTSSGSGSPSFIPSGVALTTTSYPSGSFEPVLTFRFGTVIKHSTSEFSGLAESRRNSSISRAVALEGTREALRRRSLECGLETFRATRRLHKPKARKDLAERTATVRSPASIGRQSLRRG